MKGQSVFVKNPFRKPAISEGQNFWKGTQLGSHVVNENL